MQRTLVLFLFLLSGLPFVHSQIKVRIMAETGVNCSGLSYYLRDMDNSDYYHSTISPVLGLGTKVNFGKRFSYNLGVQNT